jgi:hypothetical protein
VETVKPMRNLPYRELLLEAIWAGVEHPDADVVAA